MSSIRPMRATDLLKMNHINLDQFTENFTISYYLNYLLTFGQYCCVAENFNGRLMGYIIGKAEGDDKQFHGHVTALTVGPEYRRLGVAFRLMKELEKTADLIDQAYFVDLYVRPSNIAAVKMYERMGYHIYQVIPNYYSSAVNRMEMGEDGYDMRKYFLR